MLRKREYDVATVIPKNNDIRLRRASAGRLNSTALITIHFRQNNAAHFSIIICFRLSNAAHFFIIIRFRSAKTHLENERVARRENIRASFCAARMLSLRPDKRSRRDGGHAPPQRHLERSAATTKEGVNGGKREGERSEQESVVPRPPERGVHGEKTE